MMVRFFTAMLIAAVIAAPGTAVSQLKQGYVSDMLLLTFREGPGTSYPVLKTLKSNTPLTVLEERADYAKVRLSNGETGWVDKQFVVYDPPKAVVVEELQKQNQILADKLKSLETTNDVLKGEMTQQSGSHQQSVATLKSELQKADEKTKALASELADSKTRYRELKTRSENVVSILEKNKSLEKENQRLTKDISLLEQETGNLFKTGMIKWFLAGVGVLLLGWFFGRNVSSRKRRRNSLLD